jgi:hypothetical protein
MSNDLMDQGIYTNFSCSVVMFVANGSSYGAWTPHSILSYSVFRSRQRNMLFIFHFSFKSHKSEIFILVSPSPVLTVSSFVMGLN